MKVLLNPSCCLAPLVSQSCKIFAPCEDFICHQNILLSGGALPPLQRRLHDPPKVAVGD